MSSNLTDIYFGTLHTCTTWTNIQVFVPKTIAAVPGKSELEVRDAKRHLLIRKTVIRTVLDIGMNKELRHIQYKAVIARCVTIGVDLNLLFNTTSIVCHAPC